MKTRKIVIINGLHVPEWKIGPVAFPHFLRFPRPPRWLTPASVQPTNFQAEIIMNFSISKNTIVDRRLIF